MGAPATENPLHGDQSYRKQSARFLYRKFIQPISTNEDIARKEYILNILLIGSIIMLASLTSLIWYRVIVLGPADKGVPPLLFSVIPAFFILLLALSRKGFFVPASCLLVTAYFLGASYAAYRWGSDLPTALLGYALTIMIASILINARSGFFMTALIAATNIPLSYLQIHDIIHTEDWRLNISTADAIGSSLIFLLIMSIAWLSNREIERSLVRARKSEQEVKGQRDVLEITVENRTRELQKTQLEKLKEVYRFAEFGQLASGLFHDILGLLNTISIRVESNRAMAAAKTTKQIENFMEAIRKQLDQRDTQESFSLVEGIEQVIQLISYQAHSSGIRITFRHDKDDPCIIVGNPFKFHQVIINLALNAIESYAGINEDNDRERIIAIALFKNGGDIILRIEDHGRGIPPENRDKIFEPFFSTKSNGKGMGIGLATVKQIVETEFHGAIRLESNVGHGSTFTITFPYERDSNINRSPDP